MYSGNTHSVRSQKKLLRYLWGEKKSAWARSTRGKNRDIYLWHPENQSDMVMQVRIHSKCAFKRAADWEEFK